VHKKSHFYDFQNDKVLKDHYSITNYFYSSEPTLRTPIISSVKLEKNVSNALVMMVPYIKMHSITDPIVLNLLRKFNLLDADLFTKFMDKISDEYFDSSLKQQYTYAFDPYLNNHKETYVELYNLINHGLKKYPELRDSTQNQNFIVAFASDYYQFLAVKNLLAFPEYSEEDISLDSKGLFSDWSKRRTFNNKLLKLIDIGIDGITLSSMKTNP
jgi:hypothetical protein